MQCGVFCVAVWCLGMYSCVSLRAEHRLKVGWREVLREVVGSEREQVTVGWRQLDDERLQDLCC
jgi:hypothetical protein